MGTNYLWSLTNLSRSIVVGLLLLWGVLGGHQVAPQAHHQPTSSILPKLQRNISETFLQSQDNGSACYPEIRLQRNTVWKATIGDYLEIKCPVSLCQNSSSSVLWNKVNGSALVPVKITALIRNKLEKTKHSGISFLTFINISRNDSGLYQCQFETAVGHNINVTVSESVEETTGVIQKNETNNSQRDNFTEDLWPYVYISAGIVVFVIMVITISMLSIRGCKGICQSKQQEEEQSEAQYAVIQLTEPVSPRPKARPTHNQSPRLHQDQVTLNPDSIYDNAPAKGPRCTRQDPVQYVANQASVRVDSDCDYGKVTAKEEGSGVMYAALNHQAKPRSQPRSKQPTEECSEYAAIRVS